MNLNWYVIPGINPVPYKQPTAVPVRGSKRIQLVKDPEMRAYQAAIVEWGITNDVAPLRPPYQIMCFWWRRLIKYQTETGRTMTKRACDQTNLLKATEDALQERTREEPKWRGIITNDRHDSFSGGLIIEQGVDVEPLIVIQIASEVPDQQRVYVPTDLMDEAADGILKARARYEGRIALADDNRND